MKRAKPAAGSGGRAPAAHQLRVGALRDQLRQIAAQVTLDGLLSLQLGLRRLRRLCAQPAAELDTWTAAAVQCSGNLRRGPPSDPLIVRPLLSLAYKQSPCATPVPARVRRACLARRKVALPRAEDLVVLRLDLAPQQRDALPPRAARLLDGAVQAVELLLHAQQPALALEDAPGTPRVA